MYYKHDKPIRYVKTCLTPIKNSCLWHFDTNIHMIHVFLVLFLAFAFINTINSKLEKLIEVKKILTILYLNFLMHVYQG